MSRNFHNLHVHAVTKRDRDRVVKAVLAYARRTGYERVARAARADRIIRIGGAAPWLTIEDDGYEISAIARAVAPVVRGPILEAYCEASAIVWLEMIADGKRAGSWGMKRSPPARLVEPILVKGTAAELAKAWRVAIRQTFPETALAVAAERFGIKVARMFGDTLLRGTTLALRLKRDRWTPRYCNGEPSFEVGWGSNQGYGRGHLVFEGQLAEHRVRVDSKGGPGRGFTVRFGGSAIEQGLIEIVEVRQDAMALVRTGDAWSDPAARVPAGLVDEPDVFSIARAERERVRKITSAAERWLDIKYRACKEGEGTLTAVVESGGGRGEGRLELVVMWKPWRPRTALAHVGDHTLFAMHHLEHVYAHVTLRGALPEAWAWARPHIEAWAKAHGDSLLRVERDQEVVMSESLREQEALSWGRVAEHFPTTAAVPFHAAGSTFRFGTFGYAPWRMDPRESLVVQLVLGARSADTDTDSAAQLARLMELADEAIARGLAYSALVGSHKYMPQEKTAWEGITTSDDTPLKLASWHEGHLRGVDKRIWMSSEHARRVDRAALAQHCTVSEVGGGLRITVPDDRPRRELGALEDLLGHLLPSQQTIEAWQASRPTADADADAPK